jgi:hypothetical protein
VTTREKAHALLDELSDAELASEYERLRAAVAGRLQVDEWGDLDRLGARSSRGVLRRMDDEEAAAGFSWEDYR